MRVGLAAFLVCAMWALPSSMAAAQDSQTRSITLQGHAPAACSISVPQSVQAANMALGSSLAGQHVVSITALANPTNAQLQSGSIALSLRGLCNQAHVLSITSANGGLKPQNAPNPLRSGFASRVDYTAQANWGAASANFQTAGVASQSSAPLKVPGAFSGNLSLQIVIAASGAGNLPLVAGAYTDTLTLTLTPQL